MLVGEGPSAAGADAEAEAEAEWEAREKREGLLLRRRGQAAGEEGEQEEEEEEEALADGQQPLVEAAEAAVTRHRLEQRGEGAHAAAWTQPEACMEGAGGNKCPRPRPLQVSASGVSRSMTWLELSRLAQAHTSTRARSGLGARVQFSRGHPVPACSACSATSCPNRLPAGAALPGRSGCRAVRRPPRPRPLVLPSGSPRRL